jgi:hypothetical protein
VAGLNGVSTYRGTATISSVGTTPTNGWTSVAEIKGSKLPSGTGPYAFVAWGNQCNVSAPRTSSVALMEVAVGDQSGPFLNHVQSIGFQGGSTFFRRQGVGFQFVLVYDTGGRGSWNSSNDFTLWARIYENGGTQAAGGFVVSDVVMHAFDLTKIATTVTGTVVSTPIAYGGPPGTGNLWKYTDIASFADAALSADKTWLVFGSCRYAPNPNTNGGSLVGLRYRNNKLSIGLPVGNVIDGVALTMEGRKVVGLQRANAKSGQSFCTWSTGGFSILTTSTEDPDPDIQVAGFSFFQQNTPATFFGAEVVALDVSLLEDFDQQYIDVPQPGQVNGLLDKLIFNGGGVTVPNLDTEPHESTRGFDNASHFAWEIIPRAWQQLGSFLPGSSQSLSIPHHLGAIHEQGQPIFLTYCAQYQHEALFFRVHGYEIPIVRGTQALKVEHFLWGTGTQTTKFILANAIRSVVWNWANNPNFIPDVTPAVGVTTVIHPGYEAFLMASLTAIPIDPGDAYNERNFDPKERLETDLGYEPTWPRFATPRNRLTLPWSGLTIAQRDQLALFFAAEDTRFFKWNRPGFGLIALVALGTLQSSSQGAGLYSARLDVVECLYLGGTP